MKEEVIDLIVPGSLLRIYNSRKNNFDLFKGDKTPSQGQFLIVAVEVDDLTDASCTFHCQGFLKKDDDTCDMNEPVHVYITVVNEQNDRESDQDRHKLWQENKVSIYFYTNRLDRGIYDVIDVVKPT